jgi:selenophosphate synthase
VGGRGEGTTMTFHQLLHELGTNPAMAKSFVAQLCQEGYILGMNTVDDVMALPQADLTDIAVHMFPSFFLHNCDALNDLKH